VRIFFFQVSIPFGGGIFTTVGNEKINSGGEEIAMAGEDVFVFVRLQGGLFEVGVTDVFDDLEIWAVQEHFALWRRINDSAAMEGGLQALENETAQGDEIVFL